MDGQEIAVAKGLPGAKAGAHACAGALRPEAIVLDGRLAGRNSLNGAIEEVSFLGSVVRVRVRFQENSISLDTFNNPGLELPERGQPVTLSFTKDDLVVLNESVN